MKRRRTQDSSDSLDLLLDTICNTFGAVIFISILIAILVGRSGNGTTDNHEQTAAEEAIQNQQQRISAAKARLQRLSTQHQQQRSLLERLTTEESRKLASEIVNASLQQVHLATQHATAVENVSNLQARNLEIVAEMDRQTRELADAEDKQRELKALLAEATELASRTAAIPRVRRTSKQGVAFILHRTRLHRAITPDGLIDDVDCIESDRLGTVVIGPRPGAGLTVTKDDDPAVQRKFDGITKTEHFVRLFVSRDSFAQFQPLKSLLIRLGYEYEVALFSEGPAELFLAPSDRESFVQ